MGFNSGFKGLKSSPQQKPDALQTSAPWQLKCFESR